MSGPNESSVRETPQVGDWVAIRAQVVEVLPSDVGLTVELFSKTDQYRATIRHDLVIERLPEPEREWRVGDFVMDAYGEVFRRAYPNAPQPWRDTYGNWHADLVGPLTLLVRDRQVEL